MRCITLDLIPSHTQFNARKDSRGKSGRRRSSAKDRALEAKGSSRYGTREARSSSRGRQQSQHRSGSPRTDEKEGEGRQNGRRGSDSSTGGRLSSGGELYRSREGGQRGEEVNRTASFDDVADRVTADLTRSKGEGEGFSFPERRRNSGGRMSRQQAPVVFVHGSSPASAKR